MAKKYSDELRERATRMAVELRRDPVTKVGAVERVAEQLGRWSFVRQSCALGFRQHRKAHEGVAGV